MESPKIDYSKYLDFRMNELEKLKCGLFSFKVIAMIVLFVLLCSSLSLLLPEPTYVGQAGYRQNSKSGCSKCGCKPSLQGGCSCNGKCVCHNVHSKCGCRQELQGGCSCKGKCGCHGGVKKCGCKKCRGYLVEGFESTEGSGEVGDRFNKVTRYTTRKFELLPESTLSNAPKNLLFGEGEFIFGDKLYIYIMADLYVIGANLYASKNKASDLSYNVYIGKSSYGKKELKFKLGQLNRSHDGKYKLEYNSVSTEYNKMVFDNNYIEVRLEDKQKTLNMVVLKSKY
jgi:hypothetical protein